MNNDLTDLISRSALKKALTSDTRNIYVFECLSRVLETIDNAPPIEYTFEEAFQKTVCENKLYCPARPHGKWEKPFEMNGKSYHKCTNCHISSELILIDNYCPNCGAKMDGKEADDETN